MSDLNKLQIIAMFKDIQSMNNAGNELYKISQSEEGKLNNKDNYILPSCVLIAFTCELCMKSILVMEGSQIKNTHDLRILFNSLPAKHKKEIKDNTVTSYLKEIKKIKAVNFNNELELISKTFVNIRYFYENIETHNGHLLNFGFLDSFRFSLLQQFVVIENNYAKEVNTN